MIKEINISSQERYQLIDITDGVEKIVKESGVDEGLVLIFTPHSTAAVLITENEDGLKKDWLSFFKKMVSGFDFKHNIIDNNADSHLLSGLLGQGKVLPIENKKLVRGVWQNIFFVELDGPRDRKVVIKIIK